MNKRTYLVADAIIDTLKAHWIDVIFGYPWWAILPFYDTLTNKDIKHVLVRNEQWAAFAAQWYARSTWKLGVCLSTSGPWATNLLTWIADAYLDSIPLLCITAQVPLWMIWKDMFQEVDMTWITLNVTKHNYLVEDPSKIVYIVTEAIKIATTWRPWPVHIDVPKDIMASPYPHEFRIPNLDNQRLDEYYPVGLDVLDDIYQKLKVAKRPVLLVWHGVSLAWASYKLNELVVKLWIPTVSTLLAKWILNPSNANYLWMLWMHGFYHANYAMHNADFILNIWSRFDDRIVWTYNSFWNNAYIVHVDVDESELNKVVKVQQAVHADAWVFIDEFLTHPEIGLLDIEPWRRAISKEKSLHPYLNVTKWFTMRDVYSSLMELINISPDKYIIVSDVGQHQMWASLSCEVANAYSWLCSWWLWTMGFSLPAWIWASMANPDKTILVFVGDWSIQMNIQELQTLKDLWANLKVCILNNGYLWMVRQWQELFYEHNYSSVDISSPNFKLLWKAYGIKSVSIDNNAKVAKALRLIKSSWPALIEFKVERDDNVYPMVPWWKTLWQVITS